MQGQIRADGSSTRDVGRKIEIDPANELVRWRYSCPNGHVQLDPTNGGVWCGTCARNPDIDDPHHHELLDKKTNEMVPWSRVDWQA